MEITIDINKKEFEKSLIKEIARQIMEEDSNRISFGWHSPTKEAMRKKGENLLKTDKEFDNILKKKIKREMKSDVNIRSVAKEILKDKMQEHDY